MMDPTILAERVKSLSDKVKMHNAVSLGVGLMSVSTVLALIGMVFLTTTRLSDVSDSINSLELRFGKFETAMTSRFDDLENRFDNFETRFDNFETRFDNFETRFDQEIATRQ